MSRCPAPMGEAIAGTSYHLRAEARDGILRPIASGAHGEHFALVRRSDRGA